MAVGELNGVGVNSGDGVRSSQRGKEFVLNLSAGVSRPVNKDVLANGEGLRRFAVVLSAGCLQQFVTIFTDEVDDDLLGVVSPMGEIGCWRMIVGKLEVSCWDGGCGDGKHVWIVVVESC